MKSHKKIHPERDEKEAIAKVPKKKSSPERTKLVVKDFAEASVNESISKMQKQIRKLESSIKDHDIELEEKRNRLEKLNEELASLELIRNFIPSVHV